MDWWARGLGSSWVSFDFDPQGNVLHRYAVNGTIFTTSTNTAYGAFASWGTGTAPWGYNAKWGYYYDWETGFYYCQNRYYDPAVGRWLTRDPIGFAGGMNVYGYAGSRPVGKIDPNGRQALALGVLAQISEDYEANENIEDEETEEWERVIDPKGPVLPIQGWPPASYEKYGDPVSPVWPNRPGIIPGHWTARPSDGEGWHNLRGSCKSSIKLGQDHARKSK